MYLWTHQKILQEKAVQIEIDSKPGLILSEFVPLMTLSTKNVYDKINMSECSEGLLSSNKFLH